MADDPPETCMFWLNGTCQWAAKCRFLHGSPAEKAAFDERVGGLCGACRPQLCIYWATGRCTRAEGCAFLHRATCEDCVPQEE
jgi:hypothetical protein